MKIFNFTQTSFKPVQFVKCKSLAEAEKIARQNFPKTRIDTENLANINTILRTLFNLYNMTKGKIFIPPIIETFYNPKGKIAGYYEDGIVSLDTSDSSIPSTLAHEIGHYNHEICCRDYLKMGKPCELIGDNISDTTISEQFYREKPGRKIIRKNLGNYATSSACEFVAETFMAIANGKKLPIFIWELYNKYGGPFAKELKPFFVK